MYAGNRAFDSRFVKLGIEPPSARLQCQPPGRFRPVPPAHGKASCHAPQGFMPIAPESFLMLNKRSIPDT
jgi:hypothetical protein